MGSQGQYGVELSEECPLSYYATLNVPAYASQEEVNKAYRKLAAVFHPDKHQAADLKEKAQEAFSRVHEAYSVLSDPQKRQIYDVYGQQGLAAGMELGDEVGDVREFKRDFEEFKRRMERQRIEEATTLRGSYMCRIDASSLAPRRVLTPLFRAIVIQNSIDFSLSDQDGVHVQGQAALRDNRGAGNIIFGYKRMLTQHDAMEVSSVFGLQTVLSASSTRQLDQYSSATLSTSWTAMEGLGLQASTSRQLSSRTTGTLDWVVGPSATSGMSLSIQRRNERHVLTGKIEVGYVSALSARATYHVTENTSVRVVGRLGTSGVDLEVGANQRWSPKSTGYLGALVGMQGVVVKVKLVRGGQTFDIPINVSQRYDDWRVIAGAYILPPLAYLAASRFLVRPIMRWVRKVAEEEAMLEYEREVSGAVRAAEAEQALLAPVARRKARAEADKGGLVILEAIYGMLEQYREQQQDASTAASTSGKHPQANGSTCPSSSASSAPSLSSSQSYIPPKWIRVVAPSQYLVVEGKLTLYEGPPKSGLLGFTDPAPREVNGKELYVAYLFDGAVYETTVKDCGRLMLPVPHLEPLKDAAEVERLMTMGEYALGMRIPRKAPDSAS